MYHLNFCRYSSDLLLGGNGTHTICDLGEHEVSVTRLGWGQEVKLAAFRTL